jgi:DNA-directed RNA polymerase subunit M/transcription elongation factor TFIIS
MSVLTKKEIKEIRVKGVEALGTVLNKEQNIKIIEKYIHKYSKNSEFYENSYKKVVYQVIGDIIVSVTLEDIIKNIKTKMVEWNHSIFTDIKKRIEEHDEFIINPFEVEEGVTTCGKCGSGRVFTYQKQTRGADEPMTTFAKCVKCKVNWSYSG